jgi:hypothetical protein
VGTCFPLKFLLCQCLIEKSFLFSPELGCQTCPQIPCEAYCVHCLKRGLYSCRLWTAGECMLRLAYKAAWVRVTRALSCLNTQHPACKEM